MKVQRGRKPQYLIRAEKGLLNDHLWQPALQGYATPLLCSIRQELRKEIPGITESFNTNSRYFGYWVGAHADKVYIYVQKTRLRIDLCLGHNFEAAIRNDGFLIKHSTNYQGRNGWITGWYVPQLTIDVKTVLKWLCKAFDRNLLR